tara:strand:- start:521 stop:1396 length:876 start_codon:yes stop_codon:yes gene_type:complete
MRNIIKKILKEYIVKQGETITWDVEGGSTTITDVDGAIRMITWDETKPKETIVSIRDTFNRIVGDKKLEMGFLKEVYNKIKKGRFRGGVMVSLLFAMALYGTTTTEELVREFPNEKQTILSIEPIQIKTMEVGDIDITPEVAIQWGLTHFLKELAFRESSGNWKSVNDYGYIGLYQFGPIALKDVGITNITSSDFKNNPSIFPIQKQNEAMVRLLKNNKHYTRRVYEKIGETYNGIKVTESGLLAASHLVGAKSVRKYIKSEGKLNSTDANGVSVSDYMKKFSGYDMSDLR